MNKRKYNFYITFSLLFITGLTWLVAHYFLRLPGEFGEIISPLEPLSLKMHGAAMILSSVSIGMMLPGHVNVYWRKGRNKLAGFSMLFLLFILLITGWLLYYAVTENNQEFISLSHWIAGVLMLPLIVVHKILGKHSFQK